MRVLQIINVLKIGGAQKLVVDTLPILNKNDCVVDLLLFNGSETSLLKGLNESKCCKIFKLGNGSIYNPLLIFKLVPFLKKYDLIHVHLFPALYWVGLAKIISFSSTPLIYTEHSTNNRRRGNLFFEMIDKVIYRQYKMIITISKKVDYEIKNHLKLKKLKFQLIYNGINIDHYNNAIAYQKKELLIGNSEILIIQVSNFRFPKDQKTLIQALKKLPNNFKLFLVGIGPTMDDCKKLVNELNLDDQVVFLGLRNDVPRLLKSSDIIVLSSKHEGLSLSSIEGMASGNPFIASDVPGLTEVVQGAGILFPYGDIECLSNYILKLAEDKDYYHDVVELCMNRANKFNIEDTANNYYKAYKMALNHH